MGTDKSWEMWQAQCTERHDSINSRLDRISKILHGNGSEGLVEEVGRMKKDVDRNRMSIEQGTAKFDRIDQRLSSLLLIMVVLAFLSGSNLAIRLVEILTSGKI